MALLLAVCNKEAAANNLTDMDNTIEMMQEWDKTFPQSDKVRHEKVTFRNRFGIALAEDLYMPKNAKAGISSLQFQSQYPYRSVFSHIEFVVKDGFSSGYESAFLHHSS